MRFRTMCFFSALAPVAAAYAGSVHGNLDSFLKDSTNIATTDFGNLGEGLAPDTGINVSTDFGYDLNLNGFAGQLFTQEEAISTSIANDLIVVHFTGADVSAVGGNLWGTNIDFHLVHATMTVEFSDGASFSFFSDSPEQFLGYVSDQRLDWLSIGVVFNATEGGGTDGDGDSDGDHGASLLLAALGNLVVGQNPENITAVPLPAPGFLALAGLATLATRRRR